MSEERNIEAEASAIVMKILRILEEENLTLQDVRRVLAIAEHTALRDLFAMADTETVKTPDEINWAGFKLPKLTTPPAT